MGEFRIGRRFAQHSYPESPKGASAPGASAWGDNAAAVLTTAPATPVTVCSATITPQTTGKIRVSVSGEVFNTTNAFQEAVLWLTHTGGSQPAPGDYLVLDMILEAESEGLNSAESFSTVVRYDIAGISPNPFPIGVPVTFSLKLEAGAAGVGFPLTPPTPLIKAQIDVQEVR